MLPLEGLIKGKNSELWDFLFVPDKEMNRRELLNKPMRVQIAGLTCTVKISLSEENKCSK